MKAKCYLWDTTNTIFQGKFIVPTDYIWKEERSKIDPTHSSFRTKRWQQPNSPSAHSCQISTGQEKPSRMWNKRKFSPSPQGSTWLSWPPCSWSKDILPPPIQRRPWLEMPLQATWRHNGKCSIISCNWDIKKKGQKVGSNWFMSYKMSPLCILVTYAGIM